MKTLFTDYSQPILSEFSHPGPCFSRNDSVVSATNAVFNGVLGITLPLITGYQNSRLEHQADLGHVLANIVLETMKALVDTNDALMKGSGDKINPWSIMDYIQGGTFLNFEGIDKTALIDSTTGLLQGHSITISGELRRFLESEAVDMAIIRVLAPAPKRR